MVKIAFPLRINASWEVVVAVSLMPICTLLVNISLLFIERILDIDWYVSNIKIEMWFLFAGVRC